MKITEYFKILGGKGEYTEEHIEKNSGDYPLISGQTVEDGIIGHIDSYDYDIDECLTYTKDGEKSGTIFLRKGKFSLTSHVNALVIKDKYKNKINLEWFKYKYQPIFIKNVIGRFGVPSLPQIVLLLIDINIPDIDVQLKELEEYEKLFTKSTLVRDKVFRISDYINEMRHTVISIPEAEILEEISGKELFDPLLKNSGITEKFIYDNKDSTKNQLPIFNGSETVWDFIPGDSKIEGSPLRICNGYVIIIVRKGVYAGNIFYQNKYDKCIIAEDAIPVKIKEKYLRKVDINWFIREYRSRFLKSPIGKFSSATFSIKILKKMRFKIPSREFQDKCSKLYIELDEKIESIQNKINSINNEINKLTNLFLKENVNNCST